MTSAPAPVERPWDPATPVRAPWVSLLAVAVTAFAQFVLSRYGRR